MYLKQLRQYIIQIFFKANKNEAEVYVNGKYWSTYEYQFTRFTRFKIYQKIKNMILTQIEQIITKSFVIDYENKFSTNNMTLDYVPSEKVSLLRTTHWSTHHELIEIFNFLKNE